MMTALKPAAVRKLDTFLTEWHEVEKEKQAVEAKMDALKTDCPTWRKLNKQWMECLKRQGQIHGIIQRTLFGKTN